MTDISSDLTVEDLLLATELLVPISDATPVTLLAAKINQRWSTFRFELHTHEDRREILSAVGVFNSEAEARLRISQLYPQELIRHCKLLGGAAEAMITLRRPAIDAPSVGEITALLFEAEDGPLRLKMRLGDYGLPFLWLAP